MEGLYYCWKINEKKISLAISYINNNVSYKSNWKKTTKQTEKVLTKWNCYLSSFNTNGYLSSFNTHGECISYNVV